MIPLKIIPHGDGCWPDLQLTGYLEGDLVAVARLPGGTTEGKSSVSFRIELPDGRLVLAQTTLALLGNAVDIFRAVEEREGETGPGEGG